MATHAESDYDEFTLALTLSQSLLSYDDFQMMQVTRLSPKRPASPSRLLRSNTPSDDELSDMALALGLSQLPPKSDPGQRHLERLTPANEKACSPATTNEDEDEEDELELALALSLSRLSGDFSNQRVGGRSRRKAKASKVSSPPTRRDVPVPKPAPKPSGAARNLAGASLAKPRPLTRAPNAPPARPTPAPKPAPLTMQSVVTNLSAPGFEYYLICFGLFDRYPSLVSNISQGFPIALHMPKLDRSFTPRNHYKSRDCRRIVQEKIDEEVAAGRMSGPFSPGGAYAFFGGHYRTSPLGLVPKSNIDSESAERWRMVQDMSFKDEKGRSVNDLINSYDFPSSFSTAQNFADWVAAAPTGAQAAQIDLESAYRQMPILPEHKPYLAIKTERGIYADHCDPFGLSSSAGILGAAVDAAADIVKTYLSMDHLSNWVDDIIPTRVPVAPASGSLRAANPSGSRELHKYAYDLKDILKIFDELGFKIKVEKLKDFSFQCVYNGFAWDLERKTVWLPKEKREKYLGDILSSLNPGIKLNLRDAQILQGSLTHVCFVYKEGRARMPSINRFLKSFNDSPSSRQTIPAEMHPDLEWWRSVLSKIDYRRPLHIQPLVDLEIWVDASTCWGIALVVGNRYQAWRLRPGWDTDGRRIAWAESVAIELAVAHIAKAGYQDARVLIHSDNVGAIGQFRRGRSKDPNINAIIIRAEVILRERNITLVPDDVKPAENRADAASRGAPESDLKPLIPPLALPAEIRHLFFQTPA